MPSNRNHPWEMNITKWDKGGLLKIWFVIHWFYFFGESLWKVKETDSRWKLNRRIDARFELDRGGILSCKKCLASYRWLQTILPLSFSCAYWILLVCPPLRYSIWHIFGDARSIYSANSYGFPGPKGILNLSQDSWLQHYASNVLHCCATMDTRPIKTIFDRIL